MPRGKSKPAEVGPSAKFVLRSGEELKPSDEVVCHEPCGSVLFGLTCRDPDHPQPCTAWCPKCHIVGRLPR